jgi:hypothetical protein
VEKIVAWIAVGLCVFFLAAQAARTFLEVKQTKLAISCPRYEPQE